MLSFGVPEDLGAACRGAPRDPRSAFFFFFSPLGDLSRWDEGGGSERRGYQDWHNLRKIPKRWPCPHCDNPEPMLLVTSAIGERERGVQLSQVDLELGKPDQSVKWLSRCRLLLGTNGIDIL